MPGLGGGGGPKFQVWRGRGQGVPKFRMWGWPPLEKFWGKKNFQNFFIQNFFFGTQETDPQEVDPVGRPWRWEARAVRFLRSRRRTVLLRHATEKALALKLTVKIRLYKHCRLSLLGRDLSFLLQIITSLLRN